MDLKGKKITVVGLGRSGVALVHYLHRHGAEVTATEKKAEAELSHDLVSSLRALDVRLELGGHSSQTLLGSDLILLSPGIPLSIDPIKRAQVARIPVLGEVEFAAQFVKGRIVGVTGSNGKTTVTSLIGAVLSRAGFFTQVGGNIGTPLTTLIEASREDGFTVVELSSFQLETIADFRPHIAVVTNISPDHLDRHSSLEEYLRAKRRIFLNQCAEDVAVLNGDDPAVAQMRSDTKAQSVFFSRRRELDEGLFLRRDQFVWRMAGREQALLKLEDIPLRGWHNVDNTMSAMTVGLAAGASAASLEAAIRSFPGVEHRLEWVARIDGVDYYNDSKATNVDSTVKALEAFDGQLIVMLGGRDKGSDFTPLRPLLAGRAKHALLLGEASQKIATSLQGSVPMTVATSMADAVGRAKELAEAGDTVLLSPACASFDQFDNFEQRGRVFKDEVNKLKLTTAHAVGRHQSNGNRSR